MKLLQTWLMVLAAPEVSPVPRTHRAKVKGSESEGAKIYPATVVKHTKPETTMERLITIVHLTVFHTIFQ